MNQQGHNFQIGELYNRRDDIHERFGGSRQSGISPSKEHPFIFVFTGAVGEKFGYSDGWDEEGVFNYTGEGQIGDMKFTNGNRAIRDHVENSRDILLFQHRGKGKPYRFLGQFVCIGYEMRSIPDKEDVYRDGIIFQLKNVDEETGYPILESVVDFGEASISELRERAYQAVTNVKSLKQKKTRERT